MSSLGMIEASDQLLQILEHPWDKKGLQRQQGVDLLSGNLGTKNVSRPGDEMF